MKEKKAAQDRDETPVQESEDEDSGSETSSPPELIWDWAPTGHGLLE